MIHGEERAFVFTLTNFATGFFFKTASGIGTGYAVISQGKVLIFWYFKKG